MIMNSPIFATRILFFRHGNALKSGPVLKVCTFTAHTHPTKNLAYVPIVTFFLLEWILLAAQHIVSKNTEKLWLQESPYV